LLKLTTHEVVYHRINTTIKTHQPMDDQGNFLYVIFYPVELICISTKKQTISVRMVEVIA